LSGIKWTPKLEQGNKIWLRPITNQNELNIRQLSKNNKAEMRQDGRVDVQTTVESPEEQSKTGVDGVVVCGRDNKKSTKFEYVDAANQANVVGESRGERSGNSTDGTVENLKNRQRQHRKDRSKMSIAIENPRNRRDKTRAWWIVVN
jgi:hypothetical protein